MKEREYGLDERVSGGIFQPDTLLPSQYFDRIRGRKQLDGERRLMIAVLEDAVDVYRKQVGAHDPRGQSLFRDAEDWIEDRDKSWLFSFENICDVLDLEADYVRRGLHAWKTRAAQARRGELIRLRTDERDQDLREASGG
jgi:hypothetical protein